MESDDATSIDEEEGKGNASPCLPWEVLCIVTCFLVGRPSTLLNCLLASRKAYKCFLPILVRAANMSSKELELAGRRFPPFPNNNQQTLKRAKMNDALYSLLDSGCQNIDKLDLVRTLFVKGVPLGLACALLHRCDRVSKLGADGHPVFLRLLATAPCCSEISQLDIDVPQLSDSRPPYTLTTWTMPTFKLPRLARLSLLGQGQDMILILKALEKGNSLVNLASLFVETNNSSEMFRMTAADFPKGLKKRPSLVSLARSTQIPWKASRQARLATTSSL